MNKNILNIYNNLVKLTTNKKLYISFLKSQDTFSDRLILFFFSFCFFSKSIYKNKKKENFTRNI